MNMSQKKSKSMRTRSPVRLPSLDNTVTSPGSSSKKNQNFSINNYDRNNDGNYNIDYTIKPLPPNSYRSGSYLDDDTVVAPTIGKSPVRTLTETRNPKIKSPKLVNQTTPVKSPIKTPKRPEHNKTTPSSLRKVKKSPGNARDSIDTKKKPLTDIDIMYHNLRVVTEARHSAALANEEDFEPVLHINLQKKLNINDHTSSEGFEGNPEVDFSQVPEDSSSLQEEPFTLATGNVEYGRRAIDYKINEIFGTCFSINLFVSSTGQTWVVYVPSNQTINELLAVWQRLASKVENSEKLCMWLLSCVFLDFEGDYIVSTRFDYEQFERFYNESLKDTYIDAANKISAIARKRIAFRSVVEQKMKAVKLEKQRQDAIDRAKEILRVQQENEALKGILPAPNSTPRSHVKQKVSINTAPTGGSNNSKKNTIADQITNRVPGEIKITADDILAKEDLSIDSQFRRPGAGGEKFDAVRPERRRSVAMPSLRQRSVIEKEISEIRSEMDEAMSRVLEELTQVKAKLEIAQSEQFYGRRKFEFSSSSKPSSPTTLLRKSFNPGELTLDSAVLVHQDTLKQQQEEHTKEVDDLKATLVGLLSKIDQLEGEINQHKKDSYDIGKQMKSKLAATKIEVESSNSQLAERVRQDTLAELEERINKVRDEIIQTEEEKMQQFIQRENELKAQAILDQHESMEKLKNDLLEQQRELTLLKSQKPSSSLQKRGRPKSADKCNTTLVDSPEDISSPEHAHSRMAPKERPAKHPSKALQQSDSCGLEGSRTIDNALSSHLLHTADLPNNVRPAQSASKLPTESNVSLTHGKVTMKATRWNFFRRLITYFFKPRKLPPAIKAAPSIDSTSIRRKFSEVSELSTGTIQHANNINRTNTILTNQNKESTNAYSSFMPDGSFLMGAAGIFNILDSINSVEELTPSEQAELEREKEDLSAMIVQKAIRNFIGINRLKYNSEKYLKLIILTTTPWIVDESLKTSIVEDSYELAIATLKRLYSLLSKSKFGKGKFPVNSNLLLNTIAFFYSRDVELVEKGLDCINLIIKENKSVFDSNILPLSDLIQHALLSYNRNMSFVIKLGRVIFKLSESQLTNRERFSSNELCQLYKCVLEEYSTQPKVIEIIIKCLVKITMDSADSRTRIGENGLCDAVLDCFADYIDNEKLFILCCKAITNFCGDDHTHNQLRFCESIYPNVYLRSILAVKFKPQSMEALLTAIASIVSNNELARNSLEEAGLCEVLIDLITINFVGENCNDEILINSLWALGYLSNASKGKSYNTRHARILQLLKRFDSDIIDESIRAQALLTFQKIFDGEYDSSMFTDGKLIVHNSSKDDKNRTAKNLIAPESTPLRPPTASFKKTRVEHEDDFSVLSPGESVFVSTFDNSELKEGSFASGALEEASHFDAAENIESLPVEVVETSLEQEASKVQE